MKTRDRAVSGCGCTGGIMGDTKIVYSEKFGIATFKREIRKCWRPCERKINCTVWHSLVT